MGDKVFNAAEIFNSVPKEQNVDFNAFVSKDIDAAEYAATEETVKRKSAPSRALDLDKAEQAPLDIKASDIKSEITPQAQAVIKKQLAEEKAEAVKPQVVAEKQPAEARAEEAKTKAEIKETLVEAKQPEAENTAESKENVFYTESKRIFGFNFKNKKLNGVLNKVGGFFGKVKKIPFAKAVTPIKIIITVLVFAMFLQFLIKQYSYAYLSHDDYGYATLHYVCSVDDVTGTDFTLDQLSDYLSQHYNRWGGRVLSFGQMILLVKQGMDVARVFYASAIFGIIGLGFLFAQHARKTKRLVIAALFSCAMFGMLGQSVVISGCYWYCAGILYMVPVIYIMLGAWLMYIMLMDEKCLTLSISKLMMLPFACVLMFFGGFSIEHIGIFAVVTAAAMTVLATFKKRNPLVLVYGFPPLLSAIAGCHIMLMAYGNNSRKSLYADYYAKPFAEQIKTSAQTITSTVFKQGNLMFVVLMAFVCVLAAYFMFKNSKKKVFFGALFAIDTAFASLSVAIAISSAATEKNYLVLWTYLVLMAITVSMWLFTGKKKADLLIWAIFFGGLASQGGCLISPIFPDRCLLPFELAFFMVASRAFNELLYEIELTKGKRFVKTCVAILPVLLISVIGVGKIYKGFEENNRIQVYNERAMQLVAYEYNNYGIVEDNIALMKLKSDTYAGSTQPYGRELIKNWLVVYYELPAEYNNDYGRFVYEAYDEERLQELEDELAEKELKYYAE